MYPIPPNETLVETKTCRFCSALFPITDKDLEFYEKVSPSFPSPLSSEGEAPRRAVGVRGALGFGENLTEETPQPPLSGGLKKYLIPSPTLCPDCRQQRRLSFRNERKLYKRKCDATGRDIISIYSPDKPFKVYNQNVWWSDAWNPMDYGRDFDFGRGFFEQFSELMSGFPLPSRAAEESTMINSDYCNEAGHDKDCYLCFEISQSEKCLYSSECVQCTECVDCLGTVNCRRCYMSFASTNCDTCMYLISSDNCSESQFCANCISCSHCFLCTNLRNRKYCFKNKEYDREEWERQVGSFLSQHGMVDTDRMFREIRSEGFEKSNHNIMTENCIGDYLTNSKDCYSCFSCGDSENCVYCDHLIAGSTNSDSMDVSYFGIGIEQCYEGQSIGGNPGKAFQMLFTHCSWQGSKLSYCFLCPPNNTNLFGCIGLRNKSYCIFNKQYTKEQYEELVPRIIEHMQKTGEWGEFFPSSLSPFGYNETVAQEYYPLERRDMPRHVSTHGTPIFNWSDYEAPFPKVENIIPASKLPQNIQDIPDDILNWAIECEVTKKPFRIVAQELEFYRKHNLPIPKRHPDQRHLDRMALRNPRKLFERKCEKCQKEMLTTYSPERPEKIYCEECYNREVI